MTVHDAEPGDVYVDEAGKLWRCVSICREPTVTMDEVEVGDNNLAVNGVPARARSSGGVSGLMWNGWKRIWRKEKVEPRQKTHQQGWVDEYKTNGPMAM